MLTRSKVCTYSNVIDFSEASDAWRANKQSIGNGSYKYICCSTTKSGNSCKRESTINSDYCKLHTKKLPANVISILGIKQNKIVGDGY
jgi:hypothetical protein